MVSARSVADGLVEAAELPVPASSWAYSGTPRRGGTSGVPGAGRRGPMTTAPDPAWPLGRSFEAMRSAARR